MLCTQKEDGKIDLQMIHLTFYEEGDANEKAGKKLIMCWLRKNNFFKKISLSFEPFE
jgi:hypothetical protein